MNNALDKIFAKDILKITDIEKEIDRISVKLKNDIQGILNVKVL